MPRATTFAGLEILDRKDKAIGEITHVLFHPSELRVVGFEVRPPLLGYVVERKPKYIAFDAAEVSKTVVRVTGEKASGAVAAKRLGIDWDKTVIWDYQGVVTSDGTLLGQVKEVEFTAVGDIVRIEVSGGVGAQVAVGRQTVEAEDIVGFDGKDIRVRNRADNKATSGGVAAQAGKGAAVAKHVAGQAAGGALKVGAKAARSASKSETGKAVAEGWRSFTSGFKDGLKGEDE